MGVENPNNPISAVRLSFLECFPYIPHCSTALALALPQLPRLGKKVSHLWMDFFVSCSWDDFWGSLFFSFSFHFFSDHHLTYVSTMCYFFQEGSFLTNQVTQKKQWNIRDGIFNSSHPPRQLSSLSLNGLCEFKSQIPKAWILGCWMENVWYWCCCFCSSSSSRKFPWPSRTG